MSDFLPLKQINCLLERGLFILEVKEICSEIFTLYIKDFNDSQQKNWVNKTIQDP